MSVKVSAYFDNRQALVPVTPALKNVLRRVVAGVLREEKKSGYFEVSISFVDDEEIRALNRDFREKDASTDVLSFPLSENGEVFDVDEANGAFLLGDIVLSLEHATRQAEEYGHSFLRETAYLTAHSALHLLGYDHVEGAAVPKEKFGEAMRQKEEAVLKKLGITRED